MKVRVYAGLKDFFTPEFELETTVENTEELKTLLVSMNGNAAAILSCCRFAVEEGFIDNDYKFKENDKVTILPPSSGG